MIYKKAKTEVENPNNILSTSLNNGNIIIKDVEVEKIEKIIEENKKKGNKIPLYAIVFLIFYKADNYTLKKDELYSLVKKEVINNKDIIIVFKKNKYIIVNQDNYKRKIYEMIRNKKWLIKKENDSKEKEYTLNLDDIPSIVSQINYSLKRFNKYKSLYMNKEEQENSDKNELGLFEENIIEEEKKDNGEKKDKNELDNIVRNIKNSSKKMKKKNENVESLEDIGLKEIDKLDYKPFIQKNEKNILKPIENKIVNGCEDNGFELIPKYHSKKRKSGLNINIENNKPKLKLKLKEENTNSKEERLNINANQIKKETLEQNVITIDNIENEENINSIKNKDEIFLPFLNKNNLELNLNNSKNYLEEEIKSIKKNYMEIIQKENNKNNKLHEIVKELNEMKILNSKYKEKTELILAYIKDPKDEEVYEKIMKDISLIRNDNKKKEKYLLINKNLDNNLQKFLNDNLKIEMFEEE